MAVPEFLFGTNIRNPGNGTYQLWPGHETLNRFSTITITQPDPSVAVSGVLTFSLGDNDAAIDLGGGQRFLSLVGPVPMLFLELAGATVGDNWSMILS